MEKKHYYTDLILKYLAGEIHPDEQQALDAWLAKHADHRQLLQSMQSNWHLTTSETQKAETAYHHLARRLNLHEEVIDSGNWKSSKFNSYSLRIAASFTALMMLAAITYYFFFRGETTRYTTAFGETATFMLPDSSEVTLNANSSLEYAANWKKQPLREVWLNGEAFFHIRKINHNQASKLPTQFVVHTSQVNVEVLGTQFNVNERRGKTTVVLNSGKVKLNSRLSQDEELFMEPGEYVELSAAHQQFVKKIVDPELFSSWTEKKLIMDNTSLREIAQIVEDYYGIKVKFKDAGLAEKTLTGSIPTNDLHTFLTVLSASLDVQLHQEGNILILRNKDAP